MKVSFVVYSDYLCPWCFNAFVRLRQIEDEYGERVAFDWRSYLLRPEPRRPGDEKGALERFRAYTHSWQRPASESDSGVFGTWGDAAPTSHSLPPQIAARAAARFGTVSLRAFQAELFARYFSQCRDISAPEELEAAWQSAGLPGDLSSLRGDAGLERAVRDDHREALEVGATGVPGVRLKGNPAIVVGAQPVAVYRRWVERQFARAAGETP